MAPKKNLKKKNPQLARKSQNRRVSRAARLAILQENNQEGPVRPSMKTNPDEFDEDAIQCAIRLSLLENQPSHEDGNQLDFSNTDDNQREDEANNREEPVSMKTDPDEFDNEAVERAIRISLLEQTSSQKDNTNKKVEENNEE